MSDQETQTNYAKKWMYGLLVLVVIIIIFIIVFYCSQSEPFRDFPQPLIFTKQLNSVPGSCRPYEGCFYPSTLSNPISLKTGKRIPAKNENDVYCEVSWRDCNAYRDCIDGKCVPKSLVK